MRVLNYLLLKLNDICGYGCFNLDDDAEYYSLSIHNCHIGKGLIILQVCLCFCISNRFTRIIATGQAKDICAGCFSRNGFDIMEIGG